MPLYALRLPFPSLPSPPASHTRHLHVQRLDDTPLCLQRSAGLASPPPLPKELGFEGHAYCELWVERDWVTTTRVRISQHNVKAT